jgi:hypothetical protein
MAGVGKQSQRIGIERAGEFGDKENNGNDESPLQTATGIAAVLLGMMMPVMFHNNRSI